MSNATKTILDLYEPPDATPDGRSRRAREAAVNKTLVFRRFYRRYFATLTNNLRTTYGSGPPDPEEVAQQAFDKLLSRDGLDDIADLEGFVWICARNIIMSEKRAARVRQNNKEQVALRFFGATCDEFDPERVFMAKEQLALVMEALEGMPERRRRIFILNRVHGLTPEQAGRRCGVSRSSAVRHIAVATAIIAEALVLAGGQDAEKGGAA